MNEDKVTTIQVHQSTKDILDEMGSKKDTYESIILRLIENYKK